MKSGVVLSIACAVALAGSAAGAIPASDSANDAAYTGPNAWNNGSNGGFGFLPWSFQSEGGAGTYLGTTGGGGLQDVGNPRAWASFKGGDNVSKFAAHRSFAVPGSGAIQGLVNLQELVIAQENSSFIGFDNGSQPNGFVGVIFGGVGTVDPFTGGLTGQVNGSFGFGFRGGESTYKIFVGTTSVDTGIGFTDRGVQVKVTALDYLNRIFRVDVTPVGGAVFTPFTTVVQGSRDVTGISLYNTGNNGSFNNDNFWNQLSIVPSPGAGTLLGVAGLCALRRRRA